MTHTGTDTMNPQCFPGFGIHGRTRNLARPGSKITDRGVGDPEGVYKIAQAYAALGDKTSALRTLRRSVESDFFSYSRYRDRPSVEQHPQRDRV
jgi:hypothetical protein